MTALRNMSTVFPPPYLLHTMSILSPCYNRTSLLFVALFLLCTSLSTQAQTEIASDSRDVSAILIEDFEDGIPDDWTVYQNTHGSFDSRWQAALDGSRTIARSWYTHPWDNIPQGSYSEDLLVTPAISLGSQSLLRFNARRLAHSGSTSWNAYRVLVAPANGDTPPPATLAEYQEIASWTLLQVVVGWREFEVDLSEFDGTDIYIAFAHVHNQHNVFLLDDVIVTSPLSVANVRALPLGTEVTTQGIISRARGSEAHMQDVTAGISILAESGPFHNAIANGDAASGDHVLVTGTLIELDGMLYIDLTGSSAWDMLHRGRPHPVTPTTLQGITSLDDLLQGQLVLVRHLEFQNPGGTFAAGTHYAVSDPSRPGFTFDVFVPAASNSSVVSTEIPDVLVDAVGIVGSSGSNPVLRLIEASDMRLSPIARSLEFNIDGISEIMDAGDVLNIPIELSNDSDQSVDFRRIGSFAQNPSGDRTYAWSSVTMDGGISSENIDIRHTGRRLELAPSPGCSGADNGNQDRYAPLILPFEFPFYESHYAEVYVSTNGFISFDGDSFNGGCTRALSPLPSTNTPPASIVPFGRILIINNLGEIHSEYLPDGRFVIQYSNWSLSGQPDSRVTFQVILAPSGLIQFQYLDMNYNPTVATHFTYVGVQDESQTRGVTVYSQTNVDPIIEHDVLIAPMRPFISLAPETGNIPAHGSTGVDVVLDAGNLIEGLYSGLLIVESSERNMKYALPVILEIIGEAACIISPNPIDFGQVVVSLQRTLEVTVTNAGTAPCELLQASLEVPGVSINYSPTTLVPFASMQFEALFAPQSIGAVSGTLVIDSPEGLLSATVEGIGASSPITGIQPPSVSFMLDPDQLPIGYEVISLSNLGDDTAIDLEFSLSIEIAQDTRREVQMFDVDHEARATAVEAGLRGTSERTSFEPYIQAGNGSISRSTDFELMITQSLNLEVGQHVGVTCVGPTATRDFSYWRVFDLADNHNIGDTYTVTQIDMGIERSSYPLDSWIVLHELKGEFIRENLTELSSTHFLIQPGSFHLQTVQIPPIELAGDSQLVIEWRVADGLPFNADVFPGANRLGQTGPTYFSTETCNIPGDIVNLADMGFPDVHWVMSITGMAEPGILAIDHRSGSIEPGESMELTITANAEGLEHGQYDYQIMFFTNEVGAPVHTLDVTLNVGTVSNEDDAGAGRLALEQNFPNPFSGLTTIDFEVPHETLVLMEIFDVTGRRVVQLLDDRLPAGRHQIEWDASRIAGGVYLLRMQTEGTQLVRRLTVIN